MIAYQVVGDGPFDVILTPGTVSHVELYWDIAGVAALLHGIAQHASLIFFDKRGTGLSDRVAGAPTLEERSDDIRAVMDAAGSPRAVLFGVSEGVPMSVVFAASHPERVSALVLYGGRRPALCGHRTTCSARPPSARTVRSSRRAARCSSPPRAPRKWCGPVCLGGTMRRARVGTGVPQWRESRIPGGAGPDEQGHRRAWGAGRGPDPDAGGAPAG